MFGKKSKLIYALEGQLCDAKTELRATQKALEAEIQNSAALRSALEKQEAEHDEALSAALAGKIDAEAKLSRLQKATAKVKPQKK